MRKHAIKIAILAVGLGVLIWWGWVGNYSFKSGSFYPFGPREDYYALVAGQKKLGYARWKTTLDEKTHNLALTEDSVIKLSVLVAEGEVRCQSQAVFSPSGAILSSRLVIGLGSGEKPLAEAVGQIQDGRLAYKISVGSHVREASKPLPADGPFLISGVVPWLAHQRDLPLGRPIFFSLFDPSRLEFRPASLTVIDVTGQAEETKLYKLALFLDPAQTEIWVSQSGRVIAQKASGVDFGLEAIDDSNERAAAQKALDSPPKPGFLGRVPRVLLDMIVSQGVGAMWPAEGE
jgi:hypothetical protein